MKEFGGQILFLDRSDINTDEIIPARYLTEAKKEALKPYLLEDLSLDGLGVNREDIFQSQIIITRENFGCGSSREHAPWALEVNNITTVIAVNYARIFRQNMFNGGMLAIELPEETIDSLFAFKGDSPAMGSIDLDTKTIVVQGKSGEKCKVDFHISEFDEALVKAGGWVEFADSHY